MSYLVTEFAAAAPSKPMALTNKTHLSPGVIAPKVQQNAAMLRQSAGASRVGTPQVGTPIAPSNGKAMAPAARHQVSSVVSASPQAQRIQAQTAAKLQSALSKRPAQQPIALQAPVQPSGPEISTSSASPATLQRLNPAATISRLQRRSPSGPRPSHTFLLQTEPDSPPSVTPDNGGGGPLLIGDDDARYFGDDGGGGGAGDAAGGTGVASTMPSWAPWAAAGLGVVVVGALVYFATKGA